MSTVTVSSGQSLLDLAVQELGAAEGLYALATANNLAITDELPVGRVLLVPEPRLRPEVASYFAQRQRRINTGTAPPAAAPTAPSGLDFHDNDYAFDDYA